MRIGGFTAEQVPLTQNLLSVGLDSLMAVEWRLQIEELWGVQVPLSQLLVGDGLMTIAHSVMEQLAVPIDQIHRDSPLRSVLSGSQTIPLSYGQQGLWMIQQQDPDTSAYTLSVAFELRGQLNQPLLRDVLQLLVNRHESLRTCFVWQDGQIVQQIQGYQPAAIEEVMAAGWSDAERDQQLRILHERPFDLAQGPLFRTTILRHGPEQHTLLLSMHHIIMDGWSIFQLIDELLTFYRALQAGQPVDLPIITQTYSDYVAWQRDLIQHEEARLWAFWQEQLQGELPVLQLPTDYPRPAVRSLHGISYPMQIPVGLTARLKEIARQQQCTLYTLLLTAYQLLLARHTGQEEILVSLPTAGRSNPALREVIGYVTSPVIVRTPMAHHTTVAALLEQVQAQIVAVLDHQDYPFARLVERLNPPRDPSRTPVAQCSFYAPSLLPPPLHNSLPFSPVHLPHLPIPLSLRCNHGDPLRRSSARRVPVAASSTSTPSSVPSVPSNQSTDLRR